MIWSGALAECSDPERCSTEAMPKVASSNPTSATPEGGVRRRWLIGDSKWHRHPGVRTGAQLTAGERAADAVRNGMGSWLFVGIFLAWMALWMIGNGRHGFDPYPWILLNLILSTLAGIQGAILLIAARRADQISAETSLHTLHNTESLKRLIEQNTELTRHVAELSQALHDHVIGGGGELTPGRAGSS